MCMHTSKKDKKMVFLVTHHNAIFEIMKVFKRNEHVDKKPCYCWTGVADLEISKATLKAFMEKRANTLNDMYLKNQLF